MTERDLLISRYLDRVASDDDIAALDADVRGSPEGAEAFARAVLIEIAVADHLRLGAVMPADLTITTQPLQRPRRSRVVARLAAAAALAIVAGLAAWALPRGRPSAATQATTPAAVLDGAVAAVWAGRGPQHGRFVIGDVYRLRSGEARLQFAGGAQALIAAPAEFVIRGAEALELTTGSLTASCFTAASVGFTVDSRIARITDLGTEFCVDATAPDLHTVSVLDGAVSITPAFRPASVTTVRAGTVVTTDGQVTERAASVKVNAPDLGAFEARLDSLLPPRPGAATLAEGQDASIVLHRRGDEAGAVASLGRVRGDPALKVLRPEHVAAAHVDGLFATMTLSAWIKLVPGAAPDTRRGLLLSNGWDQPGQVHWMIEGDALQLSVPVGEPGSGWGVKVVAPAAGITDGAWHLVTTVIDRDARGGCEVSHHIDGVEVTRTPVGLGVPDLWLGGCTIGGWNNLERSGGPGRVLDGYIDELTVWSRALGAREIQRYYQATRVGE